MNRRASAGGRPSGTRLSARLRAHLVESGLIDPGDPVVVALSGGLDSVALLHLLRFGLPDLELRLEAAHLDHAMRPGSAADALWVRGLCRAWRVPLHTARLAPPASSEADARERRYAFLDRVRSPDALVATAHHRDDQAETVLFRAIRGTGIRGLRGIAPRRGAVVRPLLPFRRAELERYARGAGLSWRQDPTNRHLSYVRNRLRHEVIPALERARPGASESLARLAERARSTERAWEAALEELDRAVVVSPGGPAIVLARPRLLAYPVALRALVLRRVLRRFGSTPDRAGTHAALEFISSGPSGGEFHIGGGIRLERDFEEIRVVAPGGDDPDRRGRAGDRPVVVAGPEPGSGEALLAGRRVWVVWGSEPPGPGYSTVRVDTPHFPLTIRGWRPGDRIRFDYGSKKLKKLFAERRLDRRTRRETPVLVDDRGQVLWVAGVARAEGVGEDGEGFQIAVRHAG